MIATSFSKENKRHDKEIKSDRYLEPQTCTHCWLLAKFVKTNTLHLCGSNHIQANEPTSQSCAKRQNWKSQWGLPLEKHMTFDIEDSLARLMLYNYGNASLREQSLHYTSSQNFTLVPSPTSNRRNLEKADQLLLMDFHTLKP